MCAIEIHVLTNEAHVWGIHYHKCSRKKDCDSFFKFKYDKWILDQQKGLTVALLYRTNSRGSSGET